MKYYYDFTKTDAELSPYLDVAVYDSRGDEQLMKSIIPKDAIPNMIADFIQRSIKEFEVYHVVINNNRTGELVISLHVTYANNSTRCYSANNIKDMIDGIIRFIKGGLV